jgi:hypothetical protein
MARKRTRYEEDDGSTIANMNVDGMPWYRPKSESGTDESGRVKVSMRSPEGRAAMRGMLLAIFAVIGLFLGGALLFILFCEKIWLK